MPTSRVCGVLDGTSWIAAGDVSTADFAQNDYANASKTEELAQEADAFQPGDAQKVMTRLWRVFGHCRTFSMQANGTTATVSLTRHQLARVGELLVEGVHERPQRCVVLMGPRRLRGRLASHPLVVLLRGEGQDHVLHRDVLSPRRHPGGACHT